MLAILSYVQFIFSKIVDILSFKPFADFPVSIIELICCGIFIKFVFKVIYGGFNETEQTFSYINNRATSRAISNIERKLSVNRKNKKS